MSQDKLVAGVFETIYRRNMWSCAETVSGGGSTLEFTKRLRKMLPQIVRQFEITSLLDAGCGDWHWMSKIKLDIPVVGCDIVSELIDENRRKYPDGNFFVCDIIHDALPQMDAILCRATLYHLSNNHVYLALDNLFRSGARFLIATTHPNIDKNVDITDGDWRRLNLCAEPFNLPVPEFIQVDGPGDDGYLAVWRLQ
jgi:SAM-dependent methyltransferase